MPKYLGLNDIDVSSLKNLLHFRSGRVNDSVSTAGNGPKAVAIDASISPIVNDGKIRNCSSCQIRIQNNAQSPDTNAIGERP